MASSDIRELPLAAFRRETAEFLDVCSAEGRLVVKGLSKAAKSPKDFLLFAVYESGVVVGSVCLETDEMHASIVGVFTPQTAQVFAAELGARSIGRLSTCDGPPAAVEAVTAACCKAFSCAVRSEASVEEMILDSAPTIPADSPGSLRAVPAGDRVLQPLGLWYAQFLADTGAEAESRAEIASELAAAAARGHLFVWELKDKPVAMAAIGRGRPLQLLCVYTPQHQRGRGYGQALTAAVCAEQRSVSAEAITLSAIEKFGAARVYRRVGFRSIAWLRSVTLEDAAPIPSVSTIRKGSFGGA